VVSIILTDLIIFINLKTLRKPMILLRKRFCIVFSKSFVFPYKFRLKIAQSLYKMVTGWKFRESNPGVVELFYTNPERPWCPPSLLYIRYRFIAGE
jgi:hypothetical protein